MDLKKQHDEDRAEVAARFPGPDYREILALLHRLLQPARYLEIGVNTGKSFALAKSPTRAGRRPRTALDADRQPQRQSGRNQ